MFFTVLKRFLIINFNFLQSKPPRSQTEKQNRDHQTLQRCAHTLRLRAEAEALRQKNIDEHVGGNYLYFVHFFE